MTLFVVVAALMAALAASAVAVPLWRHRQGRTVGAVAALLIVAAAAALYPLWFELALARFGAEPGSRPRRGGNGGEARDPPA